MNRKWTDSQKEAIAARAGTIVVSAAAGSGKTTVLIERIIQMILSGECSVDELLIVTFTRAATAEIRSRLSAAITAALSEHPEDSNLSKQQMLVPSANIFTIDAFCANIVRENFETANVAPDFSTLDENISRTLRKDALSHVLDKYYLEDSNELATLKILFKDARFGMSLEKCIDRIYNNIEAYKDPEAILDSATSLFEFRGDVLDSAMVKMAIEDYKSYADYLIENVESGLNYYAQSAETKSICDVINPDLELFKQCLSFIEKADFDSAYKCLEIDYKPKSWPRGFAGKDEKQGIALKYYRDEMNKFIKKNGEALKTYFGSRPSLIEPDRDLQLPALLKLIRIVRDYRAEYNELKLARNSLDFSDIEHIAYNLLIKDGKKTRLAEDLSSKYHQILIDEYQDTNELQDALFMAISKNESNLFMVGDIKQSIYAFRNAMPELFLEKKTSYAPYNPDDIKYPATITLGENFRSNYGIINFVNFIFSQIMSETCGDINYNDPLEQLKCGKEPDPDTNRDPDVELHVFEFNKNQSLEVEGQFIVHYIEDAMEKDKNLSYGDFAILMRSIKNRGNKIAAELEAAGIPIIYDGDKQFLESADIRVIISLLRVIDNPLLSIDLLSVLMSPIFNFSADDVARLRTSTNMSSSLYQNLLEAEKNGDAKAHTVCDTLRMMRKLSISMPAAELIRKIYADTLYPEIVASMPNGIQRRANLLLLRDYAETYEGSNEFGIAGFVRYINSMIENEINPEAASLVSGETNAVKLMTVHASKGLEYKYCFVVDLGHSRRGNSDSIVFGKDLLIGLKSCNPETGDIYPAFAYNAILHRNRFRDMSEELRILYVALTRAKEKLIMLGTTGTSKGNALSLAEAINPQNPEAIAHANSSLELILCALNQSLSARTEIIYQVHQPEIEELQEEEAKVLPQDIDTEIEAEIMSRLDYKYPYIELATVPTKRSASATEAAGIDERYFASATPQFGESDRLTAAQIGTCLHKFMQFANFDLARQDPQAEIDRLTSLGYFSANEAKTIDANKIAGFFQSDIYNRISKSPNVMREKKFAVLVPARRFNENLSEELGRETVLIQGIADCVFVEDNKLIILDYKTDRTTDENELIDRHIGQLTTYKEALEEVTGMEVAACYLYAFSRDQEIKVI